MVQKEAPIFRVLPWLSGIAAPRPHPAGLESKFLGPFKYSVDDNRLLSPACGLGSTHRPPTAR